MKEQREKPKEGVAVGLGTSRSSASRYRVDTNTGERPLKRKCVTSRNRPRVRVLAVSILLALQTRCFTASRRVHRTTEVSASTTAAGEQQQLQLFIDGNKTWSPHRSSSSVA